MRLVSTEQARSIDEITIKKNKIPGLTLMENAGAALAREAFCGTDKVYTVVCGCGNNGGDGFVAARHLLAMEANVAVMLVFPFEKLRGDAKRAFNMAVDFGVPIIECLCYDAESRVLNSDVIIDAVLGIGAVDAPKGDAETVINLINTSTGRVVSADVPSGIECNNGQVPGAAVKADVTVTFGTAKTGLFLYPARSFAGKIKVENIGFSPEAVARQNIKTFTIENFYMPEMRADDFKGSRGKTLIVAGSEKYSGAAFMSAAGALKAGSGIVTLASPNLKFSDMWPEIIYNPCASAGGYFSKDCIDEILELTKKHTAVVCGCGICVTEGTKKVVSDLISNCKCTLVLDADGINCIQNNKNILKNKECDIIITPHIGEMARFMNVSPSMVSANMLDIAKTAAAEYNVIVVLKSASTVIAAPNGEAYINTYGSSGMATAGSGDVLAGIIGSFAAQGMSAFESAVNGTAAHALAGEAAAKVKGMHYMSATDIINGLSLLELKGSDNK